MYWDDGWRKTWGKKTAKMYRFYDAWLILYPAITSSCRPDQNFCVGIRRVLKTGLYLIILNFLVTLSFSFYFIFAWTHGQLLDLYVWNRERYEIIHFFVPKFKYNIMWNRNDIERNQLLMRMRFLCYRIEKSVVKLEQSRRFSIRRRFNMINMINHTFQ